MGCCASVDDDTERIEGEEPLVLNPQRRDFIKKINALLQVVLPECQRIVNSKDEMQMLHEISIVLDKVIVHHLSDLTPGQRRVLLKKCVPPNQVKFKEVVDRQKEMRRTHSSRADVDLLRMIHLWFEADEDNSGELELDEVRHLLTLMNVEISTAGLKNLIAMVDSSGDGIIQFDEFYTLYTSLTTVKPIHDMFDLFSTRPQAKSVCAFYDLERFLRSYQRMQFRPKEGARVVESIFGEMRLIEGVMGISRRQFQNALLDAKRNGWIDPKEKRIWMDMSQPLCHYFIDSSHNTYLTGNQLNSVSSVDMYKVALLQGCRCVEIDCWNGPDNDPIVYHGHTMTTKLRFYDVIQAINETAFTNSPYPIILSLEVHTNARQQDEMARIMQEIFGEKLLTSMDAESTTLTSKSFTPAGLLRKVLVKTKKHVVHREEPETAQLTAGTAIATMDEGVGEALNNLSFVQARKFTTIQAAQKFPHYCIVSINEQRAEAWAKQPEIFADFNKHCFTRVYPKGARMDSSNYNPQQSWNVGAQVVALNYQTSDFPMRLNRAKFLLNGRCGYVLKPRCLRLKGVSPVSFGDRAVLSVRIICGVQLPRPKLSRKGEVIDPYVQLFISGIEDDDTSATPYETKVIYNNGFNPDWNEEVHFNLNSVEMATLTVRVMEKDMLQKDSFIGENSVPVLGLRMGFRCVPLQTETGQEIPPPTALFCHFALRSRQGIDADDL